MKASRTEVRELVIQTIQEALDKNNHSKIDDDTDPIRHLGLDSDDGVDFACGISAKLDYDIPEDINPFVIDKLRRPRRVGEITDLLCELLEQKGEEPNV
jgi:acyl carrier protein